MWPYVGQFDWKLFNLWQTDFSRIFEMVCEIFQIVARKLAAGKPEDFFFVWRLVRLAVFLQEVSVGMRSYCQITGGKWATLWALFFPAEQQCMLCRTS